MGYQAFNLTKSARKKILDKFQPKYRRVIAHHITYKFGARKNDPLPSKPKSVKVVGYADNGDIEALVVSVNNKVNRPDGLVYHVTLSLDPSSGKKPVDSNNLIKNGWTKVKPFDINVNVSYNE